MPTQTTLSRVESFPFDSRADGYDADGYPVYDRAVGASMLRATFEKFFSDGVFPSPGNALQISKGSGLTVTIQPGIFIIRGAMGGYLTDAHSLTLDTAAPQGNVAYGIMLRYDETEQHRSCYLRVVRGDAGSSPTPPAPDQSTPGVMEYRLGYVTVPTGATDLTSATVTNEKGLEVCPYAAPFEEIDMSGVTADARESANEALTALLAYFESNREAIDAALSGEAATYLQQQITALQEQLADFDVDLASEVDNVTIEYTGTDNPVDPKKLRVKSKSIGTDKLADSAVTSEKLADSAVTSEKLADSAFTDSASAAQTASDKVAATPACVDAKLAARSNNRVVTTDKNKYTLAANQSINFQWSGFQVTGFTAQSDGLLCNMAQVIIVSMTLRIENHGSLLCDIYVNEDLVYTLPEVFAAVNKEELVSVVLYVEAGDKLKIKPQINSTSAYADNITVQGV